MSFLIQNIFSSFYVLCAVIFNDVLLYVSSQMTSQKNVGICFCQFGPCRQSSIQYNRVKYFLNIIKNQLLKLNNCIKSKQPMQPNPQNPPSQLPPNTPQLTNYLTQNNINLTQQNPNQTILTLLIQKDKMISVLEGQITKYKAQQMKNNKLISQLQDKIVQMSPNSNNTGSSFMMGSEFKDFFDDFMKNCLPAVLAPLLGYPKAYAKYSNQLFQHVYSNINNSIEGKISQICKIMELQQTASNTTILRSSLLKIMQDNSQKLLKTKPQKAPQYTNYQNQQLKQITQNEQFPEFLQKLNKICGYMILQEKKWSFVMPDEKIEKFVKKDFVCIDGWIKQREDVIVIVEGLVREGQEGNSVRHPNLRNYVIPFSLEDQEEFQFMPKKQAIKPQQIIVEEKIKKVDRQCQYSPKSTKSQKPPLKIPELKPKKYQQQSKQNKQNNNPSSNISPITQKQLKNQSSYTSLTNNRSKIVNQSQLLKNQSQYRSKIETAIRKLNKVQQKFYDNLQQVDSVSLLMPFTDHNVLKEKQKNIQNNHQSNNPSICINKSAKLKNSTKAHNLISDPSFQDILPLPHRKKDIVDQLPLKRQSSRTKKSNSRKTSVGKIVGQCIESKQNMFHRNNKQHSLKEKDKQCNKQAIYKDMIKQKLCSDYKTEREKPKQSKNKHKQQDRPLRMMQIKKIRDKFLNL